MANGWYGNKYSIYNYTTITRKVIQIFVKYVFFSSKSYYNMKIGLIIKNNWNKIYNIFNICYKDDKFINNDIIIITFLY